MFLNITQAAIELEQTENEVENLIQDDIIDWKIEDDSYLVDINSVGVFHTLDIQTEYIDEYIERFDKVIFDDSTILMYKNFNLLPFESNSFWINWYVFRNFNIYEVDYITLKLLQYLPETSQDNFNKLIDNSQFMSRYTYPNPNKKDEYLPFDGISNYSIFEFEGYVVIFHLDIYNGLKCTISNIFRKDDIEMKKPFLKKIFLRKNETLSFDYNLNHVNEFLSDLNNIYKQKRLKISEHKNTLNNGEDIELLQVNDIQLAKITNLSVDLIHELKEKNVIGNKLIDGYILIDIEIIKHFKKNGLNENALICKSGNGFVMLGAVKRGNTF